MNSIQRFNSALDRGWMKQVFDHVRNYMIGAFILAIGTTEFSQADSLFFGLIPGKFSGLGVIGLAVILICINLYDGIRRISRSKYHVSFTVALVLLYLLLSVRVVEMAWDFRDLSDSLPF
jgi:hypothetical protein